MSVKEFEEAVLNKLRGYAPNKTDRELKEAMNEYNDIVQDGYNHYHGVEYGCDYSAWNIFMCI